MPTLSLNGSALAAQIDAINQPLLLQVLHDSPELTPKLIDCLGFEISLREEPPTVEAGGGENICFTPSFGGRYDDLLAALGTGELEVARHAIQRICAEHQAEVASKSTGGDL